MSQSIHVIERGLKYNCYRLVIKLYPESDWYTLVLEKQTEDSLGTPHWVQKGAWSSGQTFLTTCTDPDDIMLGLLLRELQEVLECNSSPVSSSAS